MSCDDNDKITADDIDNLKCQIGVIDDVVEKTDETTETCSGAIIFTLRGQLARLGYEIPVPYAAAISFTANDAVKTIERTTAPTGIYAPLPSALPFTTSGTWTADDENKFYPVQVRDLSGIYGTINGQTITNINAYLDSIATYEQVGDIFAITVDYAQILSNTKTIIKTRFNNLTSNKGGAEYVITTVNPGELSTLAGGIYRGRNHNIGGGYYAQLVDEPSVYNFGWTLSGSEDDYNILAYFCENGYSKNIYKTLTTLNTIWSEWEAGNAAPVAFYGDSTTDGATTTGHVASVITANDPNVFTNAITVTQSPNAYPKKLEELLQIVAPAAQIYNAGFDSQSMRAGTGAFFEFGNKAFYRTFFGFPSLNNVNFSDVKAIVLSWGISDCINDGNLNIVLDAYEWRLELVIIECLERGIQPIIQDPVITQQRRIDPTSGRRNNEVITVIESINDKVRQKWNLEKLSLREVLEEYMINSVAGLGDIADVMTPLPVDGVHPNDFGHRYIAGGLFRSFYPLVKQVEKHETYQFTATNPWLITSPSRLDNDIWKAVSNATLVTRTSYFNRFLLNSASEVLYTIYVYATAPMDLTYDMLAVGKSLQDDYANIQTITVVNTPLGITQTCSPHAEYQGANLAFISGSHQQMARLDTGLNQITISAPSINPDLNDFGFLRVEPRRDDIVTNIITRGSNGFGSNLRLPMTDISHLLTATSARLWSSRTFDRDQYFSSYINTEQRIIFTTNTLHERNVLWAGNRVKEEFDSYNSITCSGTSVGLFVTVGNSATNIANLVSTYDFSLATADDIFTIIINNTTAASQSFFLQRYNPTTGVMDNIASNTNVTATKNFTAGYGVGFQKYVAGPKVAYIRDVQVLCTT